MAVTGPEYVDLVFRALEGDKAKKQAREIDAAIKGMGETQRATALAAGRSHQTWQEHTQGTIQRQHQLRTAIFQTLEITNRVIGIMRQFGNVIDEIASRNSELNVRMDALRESTSGLVDSFAQGLADGEQFANVLAMLTGQAEGLTGAARQAGQAIGDIIGILGQARGEGDWLDMLLGSSGIVGSAINYFRNQGRVEAAGANAGQSFAQWRGQQRWQRETEASAARADETEEFLASLDQPTAPAYATGPARGAARRGGGGGAAVAPTQESLDWLEDIVGYQQAIVDGYEEIEAAQRSAADAMIEWSEQEAEWIQSNKEAEIQALEERQAAREELRETERQAAREAEAHARQRIQTGIGIAQSFTSIGSTIAGVYGQLAESEDEGSEAAKRYGRAQGTIMAAMSYVQGAIETAKAIASYPDVVAMAEHAAGAAAFFVAGAMATRELGGTASSAGAPSRSAGTNFVPESADTGGGNDDGGGMSIQIYTMAGTSARLGQEIGRANRELARSGIDAPMSGAAGWAS